jgi:hypothetical protein
MNCIFLFSHSLYDNRWMGNVKGKSAMDLNTNKTNAVMVILVHYVNQSTLALKSNCHFSEIPRCVSIQVLGVRQSEVRTVRGGRNRMFSVGTKYITCSQSEETYIQIQSTEREERFPSPS